MRSPDQRFCKSRLTRCGEFDNRIYMQGVVVEVKRNHCQTEDAYLCGFTRIELMAVLGALGLLTMVLLPGWAATGRKAGILECKNNLRQVAVAMDQYTKGL